ncbi:heparinase II/III family protein [soil metagenome]
MTPPTARAANAILAGTASSLRLVARLRDTLPLARCTGLLWPVKPLLRGDAAIARDLYRNRFHLAGIEVIGGTDSIFAYPSPNADWTGELHGFSWLRHLESGGGEMFRAAARVLVSDWIARLSAHPREACFQKIRAARLLNLAKYAPFLLSGSGQTFREPFLRQIARQAASLAKERGEPGDRLCIAIALAHAVTVFDGLTSLRSSSWERLEHELDHNILPDGGPVSRNPAVLAALLLDLLPLRMAVSDARQPVARKFNAAVERMLPMARFFSHGDGGLAIFQGATSPLSREMRAIFDTDPDPGQPVAFASHSGFCRLAAEDALVIADAGEDRACTGPLAFEFSDGPYRIVVNCGLPPGGAPDWTRAASSVSAHSTADFEQDAPVDGLARFAFWRAREKPPERSATHQECSQGSVFRAINRARDIDHERDLFLAANGSDLRGEDRFALQPSSKPIAFALRFHLHPSVRAIASKDGTTITLMLPNKTGWRFSSRGAAMTLEDSVYLAGQPEPRRTAQIVLRGIADEPGKVNWAFKRLEKRANRSSEEKAAPQLPF